MMVTPKSVITVSWLSMQAIAAVHMVDNRYCTYVHTLDSMLPTCMTPLTNVL